MQTFRILDPSGSIAYQDQDDFSKGDFNKADISKGDFDEDDFTKGGFTEGCFRMSRNVGTLEPMYFAKFSHFAKFRNLQHLYKDQYHLDIKLKKKNPCLRI